MIERQLDIFIGGVNEIYCRTFIKSNINICNNIVKIKVYNTTTTRVEIKNVLYQRFGFTPSPG